jgi:voltage-gated potassium channel
LLCLCWAHFRRDVCGQVCIVAFSLEYILKLLTCTQRPTGAGKSAGFCSFFWKPMCLVDIVAIMPFWIELFFGGEISLGVLRMLRMTRIFRVLKVGSFAQDLQLFTDGMSRASEGLVLLFFMLILYFCVFATLLYMAEYDAQVDCTK